MPASVRGAKQSLSTRMRQLPLAKTEAKREKLKDEITGYIEFLYAYAKAGEETAKTIKKCQLPYKI